MKQNDKAETSTHWSQGSPSSPRRQRVVAVHNREEQLSSDGGDGSSRDLAGLVRTTTSTSRTVDHHHHKDRYDGDNDSNSYIERERMKGYQRRSSLDYHGGGCDRKRESYFNRQQRKWDEKSSRKNGSHDYTSQAMDRSKYHSRKKTRR